MRVATDLQCMHADALVAYWSQKVVPCDVLVTCTGCVPASCLLLLHINEWMICSLFLISVYSHSYLTLKTVCWSTTVYVRICRTIKVSLGLTVSLSKCKAFKGHQKLLQYLSAEGLTEKSHGFRWCSLKERLQSWTWKKISLRVSLSYPVRGQLHF